MASAFQLPRCAGCGHQPVRGMAVLCDYCAGLVATSSSYRWSAPTGVVDRAPTRINWWPPVLV